jgi:hypothetical protein
MWQVTVAAAVVVLDSGCQLNIPAFVSLLLSHFPFF